MRAAVTITARMKSRRLPQKTMLRLKGKPLVEHLIERLKMAKLPDEIILCTSTNPHDDVLVEIAEKNGIKVFRGDEIDVLDRLLKAAKKYSVDFIVATTGDNPFTDCHYVDKLIEKFRETNADYITCLDLPLGAFSYGVKVNALETVVKLKKEKDTEIWGVYFTSSKMFHVEKIEVEKELRHPNIRLTVDTPEDFRLVQEIFKRLYKPGKIIELREVVELLKQHPELSEINKSVEQRKASPVNLSRFEK